MKKIFIVIGIVFAVYVSFVTADCIRLKKAETETAPFITVSSTESENRKYYTGLGYTVGYYTDKFEDADGNVTQNVYGAEFRLFGKILVWAWIE